MTEAVAFEALSVGEGCGFSCFYYLERLLSANFDIAEDESSGAPISQKPNTMYVSSILVRLYVPVPGNPHRGLSNPAEKAKDCEFRQRHMLHPC